MPTSQIPPTSTRSPLRLRMADHPGRDTLDGGWWPQSRDLAVELADLTDHFPPELGRIQRAVFSPPDWDPAPRRIPVGRGGFLEVGSFPADDTHVVILRTSDRLTLRVLVVPPGLTADQGDEAMTAAATSGNSHSAASLLETVLDEPDRDPRDQWTDAPSDPWSP